MRLKDALAEALRQMRTAIDAVARRLRFHPARLPAVAVAAHVERPLRGGLGADPDAVRVLRARRPVRSRADDQEGARASQSRARDRRPAAHDVRPAQHARAERRRRARAAFRRQALPHGRCRATCGSPRRRRTAFRRSISTGRRRARRRISRSPARCCGGWKRATPRTRRGGVTHDGASETTMIRPKGLGRGLDALLPAATSRAAKRGAADARRSTACVPASTSRARGWTTRRSTSSPQSIREHGDHAADPRAARSTAAASRSSPASAAGARRSARDSKECRRS